MLVLSLARARALSLALSRSLSCALSLSRALSLALARSRSRSLSLSRARARSLSPPPPLLLSMCASFYARGQVHGYPQSPLIGQGFVAWDIVAALHVTHPALFSAPRCLSIHGFADRAMVWRPAAGCDGAGPRNLSLNHSNLVSFMGIVEEERVLLTALDLIYKCPAVQGAYLPVPLTLRLGLAPELLATLLAGVALVAVLLRGISRCRLRLQRAPSAPLVKRD